MPVDIYAPTVRSFRYRSLLFPVASFLIAAGMTGTGVPLELAYAFYGLGGLCVIVWLVGHFRPGPFGPDRQTAIQKLKQYVPEKASVSIMLYPESQRPLADRILALFRDAGWNAGSPSASFEKWHGYFKGIVVRGCDTDRIEAVAEALTTAGVPMVRTLLEENELSPDHPKYQQRRQSVQVRVGYTDE